MGLIKILGEILRPRSWTWLSWLFGDEPISEEWVISRVGRDDSEPGFDSICKEKQNVLVFCENSNRYSCLLEAVQGLGLSGKISFKHVAIDRQQPEESIERVRKLQPRVAALSRASAEADEPGEECLAVMIVDAGSSSDAWFDPEQYRLYPALLQELERLSWVTDIACFVFPYQDKAKERWLNSGTLIVHHNKFWPPKLRNRTYLLIKQRRNHR